MTHGDDYLIPDDLNCPQCKASSISRSNILVDNQWIENHDKRWTCNSCGFKFLYKDGEI